MGDIHKVAEPDHIIKDVVGKFPCRVLWSEGRPCLEYQREEGLGQIEEYVRTTYNVEPVGGVFHSGGEPSGRDVDQVRICGVRAKG